MNLVEKYDTIVAIAAFVAAIGMLIGMGLGIFAAGLFALKFALGYKPKEKQ